MMKQKKAPQKKGKKKKEKLALVVSSCAYVFPFKKKSRTD
jgi:hypothetical protein